MNDNIELLDNGDGTCRLSRPFALVPGCTFEYSRENGLVINGNKIADHKGPLATPIIRSEAERTPFDVIYGPRTINGQMATGFAVGVRMADKDVIVFGATAEEAKAAAQMLGGEFFGESTLGQRCVLVREGQVTAC